MSFTRMSGEGSARHEHLGLRRRREWTPDEEGTLELVQRLPEGTTLLAGANARVGELFNLLVRKAGRPPARARKAILSWRDIFPLIETSAEVMLAAADLADRSPVEYLGLSDSICRRGVGLPASFVGRLTGRLHLEGSHRHKPIRTL